MFLCEKTHFFVFLISLSPGIWWFETFWAENYPFHLTQINKIGIQFPILQTYQPLKLKKNGGSPDFLSQKTKNIISSSDAC